MTPPPYKWASVNFCDFEELYLCYFLTNLFQTWQFCQFKGALSSRDERFSPYLYNLLRKIIISIFVSWILILDPCTNILCHAGQECAIVGRNAACNCKKSCPESENTVCGSNGITFPNHCELHRTACLEGKKISIKHDGTCKGVYNTISLLFSPGGTLDFVDAQSFFGGVKFFILHFLIG